MKRSILTIAAVFAALLLASGTSAATKYFYHTELTAQAWSSAYWRSLPDGGGSPTSAPGTSDRAVIEADCLLTSSTEVESIKVELSKELTIQPSQTLTLNNGSSSDSDVDGTITLGASSPNYGNLAFKTSDHELTGNGSIDGQGNDCTITLDTDGQVLTNNITISGALQIKESGDPNNITTSFVNDTEGLVHADIEGTLAITDIDSLGSPTGDWRVSTYEDATLNINVACMTMSGNFYVDTGTLDIDADVGTDGDLSFTSGTIDVANGVSFQTRQDAPVYYCYIGGWYTDSCAEHSNQDGRVPGVDDRVVVCSGMTYNVTEDTTWDTVDVQGKLYVQDNCTLTLQNNNNNLGGGAGNDHSVIDDTIYLTGSGSTLNFTRSNHEIGGDGKITGQDNDAIISISDSNTLTINSGATVEGSLLIHAGSGTFDNDGVVEANHSCTDDDILACYSGTFTGNGVYKASISGGALWFSLGITDATGLDTDFDVTGGVLDIDTDVWTTGDLTFTGGTISVANGVSFKINQ